MTLTEWQRHVESRMLSGARFDDVEDEINSSSDLNDNERTALWLLALSYVHTRQQRRMAMGMLALASLLEPVTT